MSWLPTDTGRQPLYTVRQILDARIPRPAANKWADPWA